MRIERTGIGRLHRSNVSRRHLSPDAAINSRQNRDGRGGIRSTTTDQVFISRLVS
jgi:hypothetical protein